METRLLLTTIFCMICGCAASDFRSASKRALSDKHHVAATYYAVQALKLDPEDEDAQALHRRAVEEGYRNAQRAAEERLQAGEPDGAVVEYDRMLVIEALAKDAQGDFQRAPDVASERDRAAAAAAERHYQTGLKHEAREKMMDAAAAYRKAFALVPGFRDAESRYRAAQSAAVRRIAVLAEDKTGKNRALAESIASAVVSDVMDRNPEFIEFVDRLRVVQLIGKEAELFQGGLIDAETVKGELVGKLKGVHAFVFVAPAQIRKTEGQWRTDKRENTVEETVYNKKGKAAGKRRLTARWTENVKRNEAAVTASYQIIEVASGRILDQKQIDETSYDEVRYASDIRGDQKAFNGTTGTLREPDNVDRLLERCSQSLASSLASALEKRFSRK